MTFWDYFQAIAVICLVLFGAFYITKVIAKSGGGGFRKCSGMKLIGTLSLGKDKGVAVVEIGKHAYVLGIGGQRVERLDKIELSELDLKEDPSVPPNFPTCFRNELNSRLNQWKRKK